MKVFITKYALTQGILEMDGEICEETPSMVVVKAKGILYCNDYFHGEGGQWHCTLEAAQRKAEEMSKKKIVALKKQIGKLEKLNFNLSKES